MITDVIYGQMQRLLHADAMYGQMQRLFDHGRHVWRPYDTCKHILLFGIVNVWEHA